MGGKFSAGRLAVSIVICLAAGAVGSAFTFSEIQGWYSTIAKPVFTPPGWVFGPVWTTLYILMGISLYMVWQEGSKAKGFRPAITAFGVQLLLNIAWSAIFFGLKLPFAAFVEITLLWVSIASTIALFYRVSRRSALPLLPYIAWVSIAALLNYSVMVLNA